MTRVILGLDPGTATTGFGVVAEERGQVQLVDCGYIATSPTDSASDRLLVIANSIEKIIKQYQPEVMAIEKLFFGSNRTTAIAVAQARGTILTVAAKYQLEVIEYTPMQVKQFITGYGRADKKQMQRMVGILLKLEEPPHPDDVADALAIAICAAQIKPRVVK